MTWFLTPSVTPGLLPGTVEASLARHLGYARSRWAFPTGRSWNLAKRTSQSYYYKRNGAANDTVQFRRAAMARKNK